MNLKLGPKVKVTQIFYGKKQRNCLELHIASVKAKSSSIHNFYIII